MTDITPPPHLSVSSIQTFQQCPQKFKFNKIDLIQDSPGKEAMLGNFVHDVLEALYTMGPSDRTVSSAQFLSRQIWNDVWSQPVSDLIHDPNELRNFRWSAWWCIENLWNVENPELVTPVGLEREVYGDVGGVIIKGFIDRFSASDSSLLVTVSDYKTGKAPKPAYQDDKFFQLFVYAYLLSHLGIAEADKVELIYLKENKKLVREVDDESLETAVEIVQETKSDIDMACKTGNFPANTSALCNWCSYKKICPAWK